MRLLPHANNSGGFFVALFRKLKPVIETAVPSVQHRIEACTAERKNEYYEERNKRLGRDTKETAKAKDKDETPHRQIFKGIDPIICLEGHAVVQEVTAFYGLEGIDLGKNLISRNLNNNEPRKAYFISTAIKELIDNQYDTAIRITSLGQQVRIGHSMVWQIEMCSQVLTRAFQRKEGSPYQCIYRFCQEGLPLVLPYITKQKLYLRTVQMKQLLTEKTLKIPNPNNADSVATITDGDVIEKMGKLEQGGCIVLLDDVDASRLKFPLSTDAGGEHVHCRSKVNADFCAAGLTARAPLAVCGWLISPYTLNLMVPKEDTANVLMKLVQFARFARIHVFCRKKWKTFKRHRKKKWNPSRMRRRDRQTKSRKCGSTAPIHHDACSCRCFTLLLLCPFSNKHSDASPFGGYLRQWHLIFSANSTASMISTPILHITSAGKMIQMEFMKTK